MPSYFFNSPYLISLFNRIRNVKPFPTFKIMHGEIDEKTSVDINLHRGMEDPRLFDEFEQWFASNFTIEGTI